MKIKSIVVQALLIAFILSACAPAIKVAPTETLIPLITPTATNTFPTPTPLSEDKILDVDLSVTGTKLAVYANTGIYIYDTETLSKTMFQDFRNLYYGKYEGIEPSGAIAFSSDGNTIAISGKFSDTPVKLWDLRTGQYLIDINDIPPAYQVTKIQFSPDDKSIFIQSNYDWTMRCETADANFSLHMLDLSDSPKATKLFNTEVCQLIPSGFIRFTDNKEFLLFVQLMGPEYWVTTLDITPFAVAQKHVYEDAEELYDISPNGKIYAFLGMKDHLLVTNLVEANTSKTLQSVPYRVKLLNDEHRFLVRDFSATESEWKLLENGNIACTFSGLTNSRFSWELSENGEFFAVLTSSNDVIIWNVSSCSIKNVLHFGK